MRATTPAGINKRATKESNRIGGFKIKDEDFKANGEKLNFTLWQT
jgi:hypothetical protein